MNDMFPKAQELFLDAIKLPPSQWGQFLDGACGKDQSLRQRMGKLLDAHQEAGTLHRAENVMAVTSDQPHEHPGTQIGPYKLLEQIGEGGMGVVYMAEQKKPVRRLVALKIVKPGMDSRQVIARFDAERQALAMMEHPNIARIIDAGTTELGRPYFVMELVRGIPINEFCDQKRLTLRERLELFLQVCLAVQHAHQKGIIHRDLKPTNVLVTMLDVQAVPKVIDFGIAKAFGPQLTDHTQVTGFAQFVGTPQYMSPEQAEMNQFGVDTRSDVYSLGVMLYELLTGTTPFDKEVLKKTNFEELRRMLREEDPPRPSARISTLDARALSTVSERRCSEPRRITTDIRGELDWIVMKALDKDRTRRYQSSAALAEDIQRYLSDEAVHAHPPSKAYRLGKLARRNKVLLTTTTLISLSLLIGAAASVWQAREADAARKNAEMLEDLADQRYRNEQSARRDAENQGKLAEERFQIANRAIDSMYNDLLAYWTGGIPATIVSKHESIGKLADFYGELTNQVSDKPATRYSRGLIFLRIHELEGMRGMDAQAEMAGRKALDQMKELTDEIPGVPKYRFTLAKAYGNFAAYHKDDGSYKESLHLHHAALDQIAHLTDDDSAIEDRGFLGEYREYEAKLRLSLGNTLWHRGGDKKNADREFRKALELLEQLEREFPNNVRSGCSWIANYDLGRLHELLSPDDARDYFVRAEQQFLETAMEFRDSPKGLATHVSLLAHLGRGQEAIDAFELTLQRQRPIGTTLMFGMVKILVDCSDEQFTAFGPDRAEELAASAVDIFPDAFRSWSSFYDITNRVGGTDAVKRSLDRLLKSIPTELPGVQSALAYFFFNCPHPEIRDQPRAIALAEKYFDSNPTNADARANLVKYLASAEDISLRQPRRALQLANELVGEDSTHGMLWHLLGIARYRNGDFVGAAEALTEGRKVGLDENRLTLNWLYVAMTHKQMGNSQLSKDAFLEAVRVPGAAKRFCNDPNTTSDFGSAELNELRREAQQVLELIESFEVK